MLSLTLIAAIAIVLWLGLTQWFSGMLARAEDSHWRRLGNTALAGLCAAVIVIMLAVVVVGILRARMRH